jgi:tryptophan-rich sensory protein
MSAFDRSLFWNVVVAAGLGCVIDGLIFRFAPDWTQGGTGFPPGWLVGCVWIFLFGLLGAARWNVRRSAPENRTAPRAILLLLLFCASYPLFTDLFRSLRVALAGDLLTIFLGLIVAWVCWKHSRRAAALVLPVATWAVYATSLTLRMQSHG